MFKPKKYKKRIEEPEEEEELEEDEPEKYEEPEESSDELPEIQPKEVSNKMNPSRQEIIDMIEGNTNRIAQLLQYLRA